MPTDTGGSDWNCHGFLDAAVEHHATRPDPGASLPGQIATNRARYVPLKDPPGIPFAVDLEVGALYGQGLEFDVFLPEGFVGFTHQFLVEVAEDGTARIYAFAGEANYYPSDGQPVTQVPGGQMVTVSGGQASAPVPFDAASLEPWWEGGSSTTDTSLWRSLGGLAAGGGCCLLVLAAVSVLVWQVVRRRRPRPAKDWDRPPPARSGAWGTLQVVRGSTPSGALHLVNPLVTIGRDPDSDLVLDDHLVSRHHAQIGRQGRTVFLYDLGSKNGTYVNGTRTTGSQRLAAGDTIRVGDTELVFQPDPERHGPAQGDRRPDQGGDQPRRISLPSGGAVLTIGRGPDNDLVLEDSQVSHRHAQIRHTGGFAFLYDLGSKNGTYLNGERVIQPQPIRPGDVIRVGRTELVV
jgi:pSer/pThr/pTyr-binding forkhead associated (FHA) protein